MPLHYRLHYLGSVIPKYFYAYTYIHPYQKATACFFYKQRQRMREVFLPSLRVKGQSAVEYTKEWREGETFYY
jgi:hypothetical protein